MRPRATDARGAGVVGAATSEMFRSDVFGGYLGSPSAIRCAPEGAAVPRQSANKIWGAVDQTMRDDPQFTRPHPEHQATRVGRNSEYLRLEWPQISPFRGAQPRLPASESLIEITDRGE
jgi:hypothetical protein